MRQAKRRDAGILRLDRLASPSRRRKESRTICLFQLCFLRKMATLRESRIVVPQGLAAVNGVGLQRPSAGTCQKPALSARQLTQRVEY